MATTTNFGWETPDDTDLVKDGAAAMRTLGNSIDTSFVDLKGGTTGQVLSKASGTDLDFTWVAQDDSNAIQNAIVDAKGDLIAATAADTPARLAVGTNGQVLTADSTAATGLKWAASSSAGLVLISNTSCTSVTSQSVTGFSATYQNYRIIVVGDGTAENQINLSLRDGSTDSTTGYYGYTNRYFSSNASQSAAVANGTSGWEVGDGFTASTAVIDLMRPFEAKRTSIVATGVGFHTDSVRSLSHFNAGVHNVQTAYNGFTITWFTGAFTGNVYLYGYAK